MTSDAKMFPAIEPYEQGMLPVGDGNLLYWESCGNRDGTPAVYLHGGPGSGASPGARRYFDPAVYRIIIFDQRGCGRSRPLVDNREHLETNTTHHLVEDLEALRSHLDIERWVVFGASWGTTLALAYAQRHRERVVALVLASVTTTSRREVDWITRGVGVIFPQQWERFSSYVPLQLQHERLVDAYASLLFHADPRVSAEAAARWCEWEDAHVSLNPGHAPDPRFRDPEFRLRFARLVTHYWRHAAFLDDEELIRHAGTLRDIPGILIHGRYDVSSPLLTAWLLHKAWSGSELRVPEAGHGGQAVSAEVASALNRLASIARR